MSNCGSLGLSSEEVCMCLCVQGCVQGHRPSPLQSALSSVVSSGHSSCRPHFPSCWSCSPNLQALLHPPLHRSYNSGQEPGDIADMVTGWVPPLLSPRSFEGTASGMPLTRLWATSEEGREEERERMVIGLAHLLNNGHAPSQLRGP